MKFTPVRVRENKLTTLLALALLTGCQSAEPPRQRVAAVPAQTLCAAAPAPAALDSLTPPPLTPVPAVPAALRQQITELRAALGPAAADLRPAVWERACVGYLTLREQGRVRRPGVLAVADMELPSNRRRLWVVDLRAGRVLHHSYVAHGRGSGKLLARRFSNRIKSACTALGFYRTQDTYDGIHGLSRRLRGLDAGQNSNAQDRYIVLHAADYAGAQYVQQHGQLGYSRGCPALPPEQYKAIIGAVGEGACLLLSGSALESRWLDGAAAGRAFAARGWR
ncbi:murein L,D-transpeptidase catalytic domain family protein [Hymenobacter persicinus]|uniref:Murein L,D-transpeptidase catalytic domain family protein n=1 Tax=Hymenobacter persicinus TaxID=2025506 RepID=A0A4V1ZB99_9BACT|nr:murein L,D-transpeptidase catalytic domain family protein [Hymenobacter persicinus]RYU84343.1 murein L,D-transpeptidase catalytic domain family protein [Hymenobacter persicinus]